MEDSFVLGLSQNIALLLSLSMLYDYFWAAKERKKTILFKITTGLVIAGVGFLLILTPWTLVDGIFFDTRTILLSISGLFFGTIPTAIAMIILSAFRISLEGSGMWMGVSTIILSGLSGILWRYFRPNWMKNKQWKELIGLGVFTHILMLASTLLLPNELITNTFKSIFVTIILIYPIGTLLLGLLMLRLSKNHENKRALIDSEERWHFAIEGSGDGLWDWNPLTGDVFYSNQFKSMLGFASSELQDNIYAWENLIHPDDLERVKIDLQNLISGNSAIYETEYRIRCKDNNYKWILDRGIVMERNSEEKPTRVIGTHRDVTHRKKIETDLHESEQYTRSILTAMPDLIFVMDSTGSYLDFKSGNKDDLYLDESLFLNKNVYDILPKELADKFLNGIGFVLKNKTSYTIEYDLVTQNKLNNFECIIIPFGENKTILDVRNITQRKQAEETLRNSKEQLKNFAAHLQNIREEERIMLAREIHDELGQILVAIKMDLGMLKIKATNLNSSDSNEFMNQLEHLVGLVDNTIKTARKIMTDLRPEVLDLLGIVDAIRQYVKSVEERYHIKCKFETELDILDIPIQQAVALFRIVQEALTNTIKHAQATKVSISLGKTDEGIYLEIADDGKGFDMSIKKRIDSYGIIGMKERAYLLDANLSIESQLGKGTKIHIEMPFSN